MSAVIPSILIVSVLLAPLLASETPKRPPTDRIVIRSVEEALSIAWRASPELRQLRLQLQKKRALALDAGRLDNPSLSLSVSREGDGGEDIKRGLSLGVSQRHPLSRSRSIDRRLALLKVDLEIQEARSTITAYFEKIEVLLEQAQDLQRRSHLLEDILILHQKWAEFLKSRHQKGESSLLDINEAYLQGERLEHELRHDQHQYRATLTELGILLGVDRNLAIQIDSSGAYQDLPTNDEGFELPQLRVKQLRVEVSQLNLALEKALRRGEVELGIELGHIRESTLAGASHHQEVRLNASIPFPYRHPQPGREQAAALDIAMSENDLMAFQRQWSLSKIATEQLYQDLYQEIHLLDQGAMARSHENMKTVEEAYAQGQVDMVRLMRAREQLLDLKRLKLDLITEMKQEKIRWHRLTGWHLRNIEALGMESP